MDIYKYWKSKSLGLHKWLPGIGESPLKRIFLTLKRKEENQNQKRWLEKKLKQQHHGRAMSSSEKLELDHWPPSGSGEQRPCPACPVGWSSPPSATHTERVCENPHPPHRDQAEGGFPQHDHRNISPCTFSRQRFTLRYVSNYFCL